MNGWFPKINSSGAIASGSDGIWITDVNGVSTQISPVGTNPFWLADKLCYNRNNGTTQIGDAVIPIAYNQYFGSELGDWTGFVSQGNGRTDFYHFNIKTNTAPNVVLAKYAGLGSVYGFNLAYLAPFQSEQRSLVYNNVLIYQGKVSQYQMSLNGIIAWQVYTSTYDRQILTQSSVISIRKDEDPITVFEYLGQSWIVTQIPTGLLVYPFNSVYGYYLEGDMYYADARIIGQKLLVAGSDGSGNLIKKNVIFTDPRRDLRNL